MGADAGINAEEEKRVQAYATTSSSVPGGLGGGVERAAQGRLRASQTRSLGIEPDKNDLHRIWGFGGVGGGNNKNNR